jgi:heterodisulfide reductase subunit A-like polyferredoxin
VSDGSIGVFVCSWGSGKDPKLDMDGLRSYAGGIEGVILAKRIDRICSKSGQKEMIAAIRESGIDRFVAVACSARTKKQLYRSIAATSGLHPLAFEVASIREQAAYVHEAPEAQRKAETLVRMAVEKVRLWVAPPFEEGMPASKNVAVMGDGLMAMAVTSEIMAQGLTVDLIMSGGSIKAPPSYIFNSEGELELALQRMAEASRDQKLMGVHPHTVVLDLQGPPGDFGLVLDILGDAIPLRCGAVVLAPEPSMELRTIDGKPAPSAQDIKALGLKKVAILPSGASSGMGCSCITPRGTLYALSLVDAIPGIEVSLLGREVRAMGGMEGVQRLAQEKGIRFLRIDSEPKIEGQAPTTIVWAEPSVGESRIQADLLLFDTVLTPEVQTLARTFDVPIDDKGELLSIDSRLRPGETVRRGVFAARFRVGNMLYDDVALEAGSVAARVSEMLSGGAVEIGGAVAEVDQERCSACLSCLRICPYSAPMIGQKGKAEVRIELCQGCGACAALCPSRAIDIYCSSEAQIVAQSRVALGRVR